MAEEKILRFRDILKFAISNEHSSFYRKKYEKVGFELGKFINDPIHSLPPLLARKELTQTPLWERLFLPLEDTFFCGYTSGTTSNELFPLLRNYYIAEPPNIDAKKLLILSMQYWRVVVQSEWFRRKNIFIVCGDLKNIPVTSELALRVKVDALYCTPTAALLIGPDLEKKYPLSNIKSLLLYGEKLSEARLQMLKLVYKSATIKTHYAFSEVGPAGFLCPKASLPSVYHQDSNFYYEIIDPESETLLPDGEEGELVVTTLEEIPTPLIRYRTGDVGVIHKKQCECHISTKTFEIFGRIGFDTLKVGGFELKAESFEKGASPIVDLIYPDRFEAHVFEKVVSHDKNRVVPQIVFNIIPRRPLAAFEKDHISSTIRSSTMIGQGLSIGDAERQKLLLPSQFQFLTQNENSEGAARKRRILVSHV